MSHFIKQLSAHPEAQGGIWLLMTVERYSGQPLPERPATAQELTEAFEPKTAPEVILN